jgi:signal transduction histidine kinase/FixJ family two-component response regulator
MRNTVQLKMEARIDSILSEAFLLRTHNIEKCILLAKEALELGMAHNLKLHTAKSLSKLAFFYMIKGAFEESLIIANEASTQFQLLEDEQGIAEAKFTLASVYYKTENFHLGLKFLLDCLDVYIKYNDFPSQAKTYKSLGTIYEFFGDGESAFQMYQSALDVSEKIEDDNFKTNVYNPLSGLYLNQNNIEKAEELIEESIRLKIISGDKRGLAFAYYGRGKVFTKKKSFQKAEADFLQSISIHLEVGEVLGLGLTYYKLAVLYFENDKLDDSKYYAKKALDLGINYTIRMIIAKPSNLLYEIYKKKNDITNALLYLEVHNTEVKANVYSQTFQIIDSYKLIHQMAEKTMENKMELEKALIIQEKNKAELIARTKQDFLSNMSHEIRTPLNAVITITKLLKERADDEDYQLLESLKFASSNLHMLINDVLDFTKLETDKIQLENKPANLKDLLHNIKNTYESLAKEKGIQLKLHIDQNLEEVFEIDEVKLAQILGNLLSNAIKFTDEGSVTLSVEKMSSSNDGTKMMFKIIDTGAGIPKDFLNEIFDSFTQPKFANNKKQKGSGLGLAIVKKLAKLYGTEVLIETAMGKGSTFYFDVVLKPAVQKPISKAIENTQLPAMHVLLAEDNKINMLVALKLLSRWGLIADKAEDGKEAVRMASEKKYDIILMDIHMPEMDGYEATKIIKQKKSINKDTPVFAFTADIIVNAKQEYEDYFDGFLRKPIEVDELYRVLSSVDLLKKVEEIRNDEILNHSELFLQ